MGDTHYNNAMKFRDDSENHDLTEEFLRSERHVKENEISSPISSPTFHTSSLDGTDLIFYLSESNLQSSRALFGISNEQEQREDNSKRYPSTGNRSISKENNELSTHRGKNVKSDRYINVRITPLSSISLKQQETSKLRNRLNEDEAEVTHVDFSPKKEIADRRSDEKCTKDMQDTKYDQSIPYLVNKRDAEGYERQPTKDALPNVRVHRSKSMGSWRRSYKKAETGQKSSKFVSWDNSPLARSAENEATSPMWETLVLSLRIGSALCSPCYRPHASDCSSSPSTFTMSSSVSSSVSSILSSPLSSVISTASSVSSIRSISLSLMEVNSGAEIPKIGSILASDSQCTSTTSPKTNSCTKDAIDNSDSIALTSESCKESVTIVSEGDAQSGGQDAVMNGDVPTIGGNIGHENLTTEMIIQVFRRRVKLGASEDTGNTLM